MHDDMLLKLVADEAIPSDHDWIALEVDGRRCVVVKESKARPGVVADALAGAARLT